MRAAALLCLLALAAGCGANRPAPAATGGAARPANRTPALCRALHVRVTGRVPDPSANELSGLVRSPSQDGLLWSHDDSGSGPVLYGLRADGRVVARPTVTGAQAVDWEDIAAGPGPTLYVGDIGDNDSERKTIDVYRVREPRVGAAATAPATRLRLHYPDGAHDAEALLVDPVRGDIIVVTKTLGGATAYRAAGAALRRIGDVPGARFVTGGDVSADGRIVALRGYDRVWVWVRRGREPLTATLRRTPCSSPTSLLSEGQGEAIALDRHGGSFMTVAEGTPAVLRRYVPR
ncbi:MAG TPA: hypothetical protein VH834_23080 [Solirubrobacteraceae bacterium]